MFMVMSTNERQRSKSVDFIGGQWVYSVTGSWTDKLWRTARLLMFLALVMVLDAFFATRVLAQTNEIRSVQAALRRIGIYSGQVDGFLGPGTERAIEEYQLREKRPVTGQPDPWLDASLGIS